MTDEELLPARRFDWERMVRRVRMPLTTRCVALLLASYANPDGTRIRPGRERLARVADVNPKTISRCISALRSMRLIEQISAGSGSARHNSAAEYRLVLPPNVLDELPMLGPDESDLEPGTHESPATPVDNPVDRRVEGDTSVPRSPRSMGHLTPQHGTSDDQHGTPQSGAWDIAMSTHQIRPTSTTPDQDHASVTSKVTSPADDPWTTKDDEWSATNRCTECDAIGFVGYDDDMRPIPCVKCRPHLARVIPLNERRTG